MTLPKKLILFFVAFSSMPIIFAENSTRKEKPFVLTEGLDTVVVGSSTISSIFRWGSVNADSILIINVKNTGDGYTLVSLEGVMTLEKNARSIDVTPFVRQEARDTYREIVTRIKENNGVLCPGFMQAEDSSLERFGQYFSGVAPLKKGMLPVLILGTRDCEILPEFIEYIKLQYEEWQKEERQRNMTFDDRIMEYAMKTAMENTRENMINKYYEKITDSSIGRDRSNQRLH